MSDKGQATADKAEKPLFNAREQEVMNKAWLCLKAGPPEIDIKKLVEIGGFNTEKTASNTWGAIKKKLAMLRGDAEATPTATSAVKRSKNADDNDVKATPTKKRKTPVKKAKQEYDSDDDILG